MNKHHISNIVCVIILFLIVLYFINKENNYFSFNNNNENFQVNTLICDDDFSDLIIGLMEEHKIDSTKEKNDDDETNYFLDGIRKDLFKKLPNGLYEKDSILLNKIQSKLSDDDKKKIFELKKKIADLEKLIAELNTKYNATKGDDKAKAKKALDDKIADKEKEEKNLKDKINNIIENEELTEKFIKISEIRDIIIEKLKKEKTENIIVVNKNSDVFSTTGLTNIIDIGKIRGSIDNSIRV